MVFLVRGWHHTLNTSGWAPLLADPLICFQFFLLVSPKKHKKKGYQLQNSSPKWPWVNTNGTIYGVGAPPSLEPILDFSGGPGCWGYGQVGFDRLAPASQAPLFRAEFEVKGAGPQEASSRPLRGNWGHYCWRFLGVSKSQNAEKSQGTGWLDFDFGVIKVRKCLTS